MSREVLSDRDYQLSEPGYLIDNRPWQEEIKKRIEKETQALFVEARPTLGTEEFQPLFLPENPEAEVVEAAPAPPEPTPEEILATAKQEAEEAAKAIEQGARKNAFEIVEQARWEANDIIAKAKEDAEKELQHLKETAQTAGKEEGLKEGLEKGVREGFEKGKAEGLKTYLELIHKWNGLVEGAAVERKKTMADMEPLLIELVGDVLYKCLKKQAEGSSQMVVEFSREALKKAQDRVHLKLHLNPDDLKEVELQKDQLKLSVGAGHLELVPDARIEKGGCLLETEAGSVDVRLPTLVAQAKEALISDGL